MIGITFNSTGGKYLISSLPASVYTSSEDVFILSTLYNITVKLPSASIASLPKEISKKKIFF
jgi:hypothetical protein